MTKVKSIWLKGGFLLALIWLIALGGIWYAKAQKITPEKALAYIKERPLGSENETERMETIEGLAYRMNRLTFEERQKFRMDHDLRKVYDQMTDAEKKKYLDLTLPTGMKQMMEAFNNMTHEKRQKVVKQALKDMTDNQDDLSKEDLKKALSDDSMKKIVDQGLKSYMSDANADTKIDMQPLMEQMQNLMQMAR
jgi:hypothetical protein